MFSNFSYLSELFGQQCLDRLRAEAETNHPTSSLFTQLLHRLAH